MTTHLMCKASGSSAMGVIESNGEFRIKAGSIARGSHKNSLTNSIINYRRHLEDTGKAVRQSDGNLLFTEDVIVETADKAARIVCGVSVSGKKVWLDANGVALSSFDGKGNVSPAKRIKSNGSFNHYSID